MEKDFYKEAEKFGGERCVMTVDTAAIRKNAEYIVRKTGKKLIAVVKANAYGHGLKETVRALDGVASLFAVATAREAQEVADCGQKALLLSLADDISLVPKGTAVAVSDVRQAEEAAKRGLSVHIAVDTGMNRSGADWHDIGQLLQICDCGADIRGIFTHFASADGEDLSFALLQQKRFENVVNVLGKRRFEYVHCANSAAALRLSAFGNAVRPGLALYGVNPDFCYAPLSDVSALFARVLSVRLLNDGDRAGYGGAYVARGQRVIALIGAGYADGLPYSLKNRGSVYVNGTYCDIVGNVCMDSAFVDVTYAKVKEGDYVCVFGKDGDVSYRAAARKTEQIPYRVMTGISSRVKRVYTD